jgi:hypothetical protein
MEPEAPRVLVAGGPVERRVNHLLAALVGFMVGGSIALGVVLSLIHSGNVENCRQIEVVKHGLVMTLEEAERFSSSSPVRTAQEKRAGEAFYGDALERLAPRRC